MKKTISYLLVFCLFAFSLFSTGCGSSSSAFKFLGAVVAVAVIASSGGAASSAVFAANLRGGSVTELSAAQTKVKVYNLDASAADLRGTEISDIVATLADGKLTCTTGDDRLQVGDYLFEVYNTTSTKVFLRAILHVDGTSNDVTLEISPVTEIKTAVYKEWVAKAPAVTSITNFEQNLTDALETAIETAADDYAEDLAVWNTTDEIIETVDVTAINVPTETKITVTSDPIPNSTRPADLQSATWTKITAASIAGKTFGMRYVLDSETNTWIKFTNEDTGVLPFLMFSSQQTDLRDGYYSMNEDTYSEESMATWGEPQNNQIAIPQDATFNEYLSYVYKVVSDSKFEVFDVEFVDQTPQIVEPQAGEDIYYHARISVYNGKTYLHIRDVDEEFIYEFLNNLDAVGSIR